ncbi:uncharacterized protein PAC_08441 [Phialocephala subalpina]|uniref:PhoD-like phosphatase metallophosphatase domain-containing protein n=1 Tax=Phialocephala subalpina TaxID=576137 RepID=A0A1L7X0M5_9HELO|nr:uncharacterized protein PAC_08441 [Phialocephala subalpina]
MENLSTLLSSATYAASIISSCVLRLTVVYFVRWLPLGPRFLPIINTSAVVYLSTLIIQVFEPRRSVTDRSKSRLATLLLGRYEPRSPISTFLTVLINILCLSVSVDFVYRGHVFYQSEQVTFSRVGYVDSTTARVVVRAPSAPTVQIEYREEVASLWHQGSVISVNESSEFLVVNGIVKLSLPVRFGFDVSEYQTAYRKVYSSPSWSEELKALPWLHTYDDHEITNDWASNDTGLYLAAIPPWKSYQQSGNPTAFREGVNYYSFMKGDVSFFVLDTRRYRSEELMEDGVFKTMLGVEQLADVLHWLETEKGLKVLVSSVPFTRNWRGPESIDNWAGYLVERQMILEKMWKTEGVVVISGDRHEHATTKFQAPDGKSNVVEFSTSPLSQFYQPFDRQYRQDEETDVMIKYHPFGVSKFGVFNFDTSNATQWKVEFELVVDGVKEWEYVWTAERRV